MTETERAKAILYVARCQVAKCSLTSRKANIQRMKNIPAKQKSCARKVLAK